MVVIRRVAIPCIYQAYRLIQARTINEFPPERAGAVVLGEDPIAVVGVADRHVGRAVDRPGNPPAPVVVGVGGHAGIGGVVDCPSQGCSFVPGGSDSASGLLFPQG